jgi:hypothetical protein
MMACQEMEARLEVKELTSVETKPEVAQQREDPIEDAVVKPVKGWKKRHRDKKQAAGRRGEPKKLTRGDCGSRTMLASACRKVFRRATVVWRKRNIFKEISTQINCGPQKEVTAAGMKITRFAGHRRMGQETPKWTEENRRWKYPECNNDIRDRDLKQQTIEGPKHERHREVEPRKASTSGNWRNTKKGHI